MAARREQQNQKANFMPSPGQLYKSIAIDRFAVGSGETRLVKPVQTGFVLYCKWAKKAVPGFGGKQPFSDVHKNAVDFLGWDLKSDEYNAGVTMSMVLAFFVVIVIAGILFAVPLVPLCGIPDAAGNDSCQNVSVVSFLAKVLSSDFLPYFYLFIPLLAAALLVVRYVQQYPLAAAADEQIKALTYVPEIIGYLTMSMKLVPNLEKAVEFAAEHGRGKIAEDFKKAIWDVQLGVYNTLAEAMDALAYRWGKFSEEFKRSLMMVRASVLEDTEAKRFALLDKTMVELLESVKNKMEQYARDLSQPSVFLFYLGVLLPLILIIILPVGGAFSKQPLARADILIMIYNIVIPAAAFLFARSVIKKRPPTYQSPEIPDDHPDLPKKWKMKIGRGFLDVRFVVFILLAAGIGASVFLSSYGITVGETVLIPKDQSICDVLERDVKKCDYFEPGGALEIKLSASGQTSPERVAAEISLERQKFFAQGGNDVTPYFLIFGCLITITASIGAGLYYRNVYKRKMQEQITQMESEFRDSLYILASRMGENKPVEEALQHTRGFLPNTLIAERIYGKTVENIRVLGLPLEAAIFDSNFGSLKNLNSNIITTSMKLLVDSVQLGVNVGARTLISLSLQLTNSEKVSRLLVILVADITGMMQVTATFIAPVILGITVSLQKVVILTLSNLAQSDLTSNFDFSTISSSSAATGLVNTSAFGQLGNLGKLAPGAEIFQSLVSPGLFLIIVAVYVMEIVIIMTYFNTKIQEDNDTLFKMNLSRALPIAILVFIASVLASNTVVASLTG
ncbi:MAG: hypothetical protein V1777_04635 [Candidatus Micrarchaeota archaeon]